MRVVVTGQVGLDKQDYLEQVVKTARDQGEDVVLFNIGDMMYREAPDVRPGRILDLPLARLNNLRRAVFRDVISAAAKHKHVIVNTHATFRWKHGLFSAFDFDQLAQFGADVYLTLVDNIEAVHERMNRDHDLEHSLKDLMVWREEEMLATEIVARSNPAKAAQFFVIARGRHQNTCAAMFRLIFRPNMVKVYPSFPMSHVTDMPDILKEIDAFRAALAERFVTFDPGDVDEKLLADQAIAAAREGKQALVLEVNGNTIHIKTAEILQIVGDIDGQIYARDFTLVRQSDMIVSYIPELPTGKPGLSSGVERELQHAHEHAKDVFVIWKPKREPSPFITQTANKVFRSVDEAIAYFEEKGYCKDYNLFGS